MAGRPPRGWADEIVAALREGRIGNAKAEEWAAVKLGLDEAPGEFDHLWPGRVQASALTPRPRYFRTAGTPVHARSSGAGPEDEFAALFPPHAPLGDEAEPEQGQRRRKTSASEPISDEDLHRRLFGDHRFGPGHEEN
jgi:hypothetical protein